MRIPGSARLLALAGALLATDPAASAQTKVDMTGWQTWGGITAAANSSTTVPLPAGSAGVGAFAYASLSYESLGESWCSELRIRVEIPGSSGAFITLRPTGAPSAPGGHSDAGPGEVVGGGAFLIPPGTTELKVFVYETFNDGGDAVQDAQIESGTLTIAYDALKPGCAEATDAFVGTNSFVTGGGTEGQLVTTNQSGTQTTRIHGPTWFRFTPPESGFYEFELCGSVGDSMIAIGPECPKALDTPLQSIAFNDDACACAAGCAGNDYSSRLNARNSGLPLAEPLKAGVSYRIVVGGFSSATGPVSGDMRISLAGSKEARVSLRGPRDRGDTACAEPGDVIALELWVEASPFPPAAGQFGVRLGLSSFVGIEGVKGRTVVPWFHVDGTAGTVVWLVSSEPGASDSNFFGHVATLHVETSQFPPACGTQPQALFDSTVVPNLLGSGDGESAEPVLVNATPSIVDGTGPGFEVPSNISVPATSTDPCEAVVELDVPVAEDDCSGTVPVVATRSDGLALEAPFPCGTTTVTWTATDGCGRRITQNTDVNVETPTAVVTVSYGQQFGQISGTTRCIAIRLGSFERAVEVELSDGTGTATFAIPPGTYTCATVDDPLHTLVSRATVSTEASTVFVQATGPDALVAGDLNDDNLVNVVDWAIYVVRVGTPVSGPTDCTTLPFHADITGNGEVDSSDGAFVTGNFLRRGATPCGTAGSTQSPSMRIRLDELAALIGPDAVMADVNRDGFVDLLDVERWKAGFGGEGIRRAGR